MYQVGMDIGSTAAKAAVMKDGNIIETGTHSDLLLKKGFYFDLYNSQFEH